jgi:hypothetical protein
MERSGVALPLHRTPAAHESDQHSEAAEAEETRGTASRFLAQAKDEKAFQELQHVSSNHTLSVQPESQRKVRLND